MGRIAVGEPQRDRGPNPFSGGRGRPSLIGQAGEIAGGAWGGAIGFGVGVSRDLGSLAQGVPTTVGVGIARAAGADDDDLRGFAQDVRGIPGLGRLGIDEWVEEGARGGTFDERFHRRMPTFGGIGTSFRQTGERLVNLGAVPFGDLGWDESQYGQASKEGRILATVLEDVGNVSIAGAGAGAVLGRGARLAGGAAVPRYTAAGAPVRGRLGQAQGAANKAATLSDQMTRVAMMGDDVADAGLTAWRVPGRAAGWYNRKYRGNRPGVLRDLGERGVVRTGLGRIGEAAPATRAPKQAVTRVGSRLGVAGHGRRLTHEVNEPVKVDQGINKDVAINRGTVEAFEALTEGRRELDPSVPDDRALLDRANTEYGAINLSLMDPGRNLATQWKAVRGTEAARPLLDRIRDVRQREGKGLGLDVTEQMMDTYVRWADGEMRPDEAQRAANAMPSLARLAQERRSALLDLDRSPPTPADVDVSGQQAHRRESVENRPELLSIVEQPIRGQYEPKIERAQRVGDWAEAAVLRGRMDRELAAARQAPSSYPAAYRPGMLAGEAFTEFADDVSGVARGMDRGAAQSGLQQFLEQNGMSPAEAEGAASGFAKKVFDATDEFRRDAQQYSPAIRDRVERALDDIVLDPTALSFPPLYQSGGAVKVRSLDLTDMAAPKRSLAARGKRGDVSPDIPDVARIADTLDVSEADIPIALDGVARLEDQVARDGVGFEKAKERARVANNRAIRKIDRDIAKLQERRDSAADGADVTDVERALDDSRLAYDATLRDLDDRLAVIDEDWAKVADLWEKRSAVHDWMRDNELGRVFTSEGVPGIALPEHRSVAGEATYKPGKELPAGRRRAESYEKEVGATPLTPDGVANLLNQRIATEHRNRAVNLVARKFSSTVPEQFSDLRGKDLVDSMRSFGRRRVGEPLVPWDPVSGTYDVMPADMAKPTSLFLPESVLDAARHEWKDPGAFEKLAQTWVDKPTRVFKGAALPMSAQWQIGNTFSNVLLSALVGDVPLREIVTRWQDARELVRISQETPELLTPEQRRMLAPQPDTAEFREMWGDRRASGTRPTRALGRGLQRVTGGRVGRTMADEGVLAAGFSLNESIDNSFKSVNYLHHIDRLTDGDPSKVTPEMAERSVDLTLRALPSFTQSWAEARVGRRLVPFLPWIKHQTLVVGRLTRDHPARVAWTIALADLVNLEDDEFTVPWLQGAVPVGPDSYIMAGTLDPIAGALPQAVLGDLAAGGGGVEPVMQTVNPILKLQFGALTGIDADRMAQYDLSPGEARVDYLGRPSATPLLGKPRALLNQAADLTPQSRALRDAILPNVSMYDDAQPKLAAIRRPGTNRYTYSPYERDRLSPLVTAFGLRLPAQAVGLADPTTVDLEGMEEYRLGRLAQAAEERQRYQRARLSANV